LIEELNYKSTKHAWSGLARADNFAVRWTGSVHIEHDGRYTFSLTSDDGSMMMLDRKKFINNDGLHGMRKREGYIVLNNGPHALRIEMFERGGSAGMIFKYKGKDTGNRMIVVPHGEMEPKMMAPGLEEEIFYINQGSRLSNIEKAKPDLTRTVKIINYPATSGSWKGLVRSNHFAARWTGFLITEFAGKYKFSLLSDDGSRLFVDRTMLINNDGCHAMRAVDAEKTLVIGPHKIRLEYFERTGKAGMVMRYKGPDTKHRMVVVPAHALVAPYTYAAHVCPKIAGTENRANWWKSLDKAGWSLAGGPITGFYRNQRGCNKLYCLEEAMYKKFSDISGMTPSKNIDMTCYTEDWSKSFNSKGWSSCKNGYFLTGLYNSRGMSQSLSTIEKVQCCKPLKTAGYAKCTRANWWSSFDKRGWSKCPGKDMAVVGLFRNKCDKLYCLEEAKCCSLSADTCSR